jgi:integrase
MEQETIENTDCRMKPSSSENQHPMTWKRVSGNLVLHQPSGTYYVRKFKKGKRPLFQSTGTKKKLLAQNIADEKMAEWLGNRLKVNNRIVTMRDFIPVLKEVLRQQYENKDRSADTWSKDQTYLKVLELHFGDESLDALDETYWEDWYRENKRILGRETFFDIAKYLSIALNLAHQKKLVNRKPKFRNPDKKKGMSLEKIVSPAELSAIADALIKKSNHWLLLQLFLGAECGNRTGEVRTLRWDMVRFEADSERLAVIRFEIEKAGRKRGKGREYYASQNASRMLWLLYQRRNKNSPYVFPSKKNLQKPQTKVYQNRAWKKILSESGITRPIWFYWLRHTFYNTALLEKGLPIQNVSEYGGTSIKTLQGSYIHANAARTQGVSRASVVAVDLSVSEKLVNDNRGSK